MSTCSLERRAASVTTPVRSHDDPPGVDLDYFIRTRPRLLTIAGRIVGDVHEAEDVVQEVWLRWHRADRRSLVSPEAFLVTATGRMAINLLQSARRRHETCVAPLPHDQATDHAADPLAEAERDEAIELAVRLLFERLPPSERAAYVLREGFDYPYREIAEVLHIGTANARQLVSRARARVASCRRYPSSSSADSRLLRAFAVASRTGDLTGLEALLAADVKPAG